MTMTNLGHTPAGQAAMAVGFPWPDELEHFLRPAHFPARLDQLLATLARHQAPSHLYWRLASLPLSRTFQGLPDLMTSLEAQTHPYAVPEPI